jgi:hypothetical protein
MVEIAPKNDGKVIKIKSTKSLLKPPIIDILKLKVPIYEE